MKKRILVIDGNYFAMRYLGILNMGDNTNYLETQNEKDIFAGGLYNSLVSLCKAFDPFVQQVIFCADNKSWRKEFEPFRPYYIPENSQIPLGYKENRKEKKEDSPINYDNFYVLYNKFVEDISSKVITFNDHGLEGDDNILLISVEVSKIPDLEAIIFCTDGDIVQVVKDRILIMRNIRSKECPNGEFVLSKHQYNQIFNTDPKQLLLGNSFDNSFYHELFKMKVTETGGFISTTERKLNSGIEIGNPFTVALVKSICGDKKDNIFSLLSWKSTTGTKNFVTTENHLIKALKKQGLELNEQTAQRVLSDKDILVTCLMDLKSICNQPQADIKELIKHLKHNLRMIVLNTSNIPENYVKAFGETWNKHVDTIINERFDINTLQEKTIFVKDSAVNILADSLPDEALRSLLNS